MRAISRRWMSSGVALVALAVGLMAAVPAGQGVTVARSAFPVGSFKTHLDGFAGIAHARVRLFA